MPAGWRGWLEALRNAVYFLGALVVAAVVVEIFPALRELEAWMEDREDTLLWITMPICIAGVLLLAGRMGWHAVKHPNAGPLVFRIGDLKRSTTERRRFPWLAAWGAALIFVGVLGTLIVVTPIALKLLLAAVALYAVVRTGWAVFRA